MKTFTESTLNYTWCTNFIDWKVDTHSYLYYEYILSVLERISGLVVAGFLPLWYIYCWIAVKSLYRLLAILDTETER